MSRLVYVILGHQYEHVGLMLSLKRKGLLDRGEYFVVGIDIEQYDAQQPDKYLRGLLQDTTEADAVEAFHSYLAIVPSAHLHFDRFVTLVSVFFIQFPIGIFKNGRVYSPTNHSYHRHTRHVLSLDTVTTASPV